MKIIHTQADKFYPSMIEASHFRNNVEASIDEVRGKLGYYYKDTHKLIFLNRLRDNSKVEYEKHLPICKVTKGEADRCSINEFYEALIFFLTEEMYSINETLPETEFSLEEREDLAKIELTVIDHLKHLQLGQEIIYEDLKEEIKDLKNFLFLNKKNWTQLLMGKLTDMVAGGVIEEGTSKQILDFATDQYNSLIK